VIVVTDSQAELGKEKIEGGVMQSCRFAKLVLFVSFIFALGTFGAFAIGNEAANYELLESIQGLNINGVQEALSKGADPNFRNPKPAHYKTLKILMIYFVVQKNERGRQKILNITKLLIDHGAKVEASENDILFSPIAQGYVPLVKLLLDNGASPFRNIEGRLPMEWAIYYRQDKVVDLLKKYGAQEVNARGKAQINLLKAVEDNDLKGIADALQSGARLNERDSSGLTPLIQALRIPVYRIDQLLVIKFLLNHGADPNMKGESDFKGLYGIPIHLAVVMNTLSIKKPQNNSDKMAFEVLQELIKHGAKVSALDSRGRTPLHLAAKEDNVVAARLLLESGCRVMPQDALGKAPLDYAESAEMISLLKQHGAKEMK